MHYIGHNEKLSLILFSFLYLLHPFDHPNIYLTFSVVNCVTIKTVFVMKIRNIESKRANYHLVSKLRKDFTFKITHQSAQWRSYSFGEKRVTVYFSQRYLNAYIYSHPFDKSDIDFRYQVTQMSWADQGVYYDKNDKWMIKRQSRTWIS